MNRKDRRAATFQQLGKIARDHSRTLHVAGEAQLNKAGIRLLERQRDDGEWQLISKHDDFPEALRAMSDQIMKDPRQHYRIRRAEENVKH